jgi:stearoyl-CoA desaturase (Delta-9 desaturase)
MQEAKAYMHHKHAHGAPPEEEDHKIGKEKWSLQQVQDYKMRNPGCCLLLIDGLVVDVTSYLGEHVGGSCILYRIY